jgi:DNA repair exonuclease SbcCD ATPase subunit
MSNIEQGISNAEVANALEEDLPECLNALDELAYRLADEQLRLVEQAEKLAAARVQWEKEHYTRVKELEGRNLQLRKDERILEERNVKLLRDQVKTDRFRQVLETWQARLTLETVSWKAERERLLAHLHSLETRTDRLSAILGDLPGNQQETNSQADSTIIEKHRQAQAEAEYARLRQELHNLQGQRAADEQQIEELSALVERLAGFLLEDGNRSAIPISKAA